MTKPWQLISNFLITKTSLWQLFTACPNGNPNCSLFRTINNLSDNVMFIRDFNSKLESFGCAKKNAYGPNLIYLNNDEHTHMDRANGSTDLLDMVFISPNLAKHDIQFQIGDDLGSNHLPIEVSIYAPPHRNSSINHTKYKFDQTDREVFEQTLEAALDSVDFSTLTFTISTLTLSYLQSAFQLIKPFHYPKAFDLRIDPFLMKQ